MALDSQDSETRDFIPEFRWVKLDGQAPCFNFRRLPDPVVFDPFMTAMASAVIRMPALKQCMCDFTQARAATIITTQRAGPDRFSALLHQTWSVDPG